MNVKLSTKERNEPISKTWGRIKSRIENYSNDKRLRELAKKFNHDMHVAKIQEHYFVEDPDGYLIENETGKQESVLL